jgi:hypothetical protein
MEMNTTKLLSTGCVGKLLSRQIFNLADLTYLLLDRIYVLVRPSVGRDGIDPSKLA